MTETSKMLDYLNNPYLCIRIRPAQYEVLSSYLSGLVVLAGLFLFQPLNIGEIAAAEKVDTGR